MVEFCQLPSVVCKLTSRGNRGISWGIFVSFLNSMPVFSFVEQKADRLFSSCKDFLHKEAVHRLLQKPTFEWGCGGLTLQRRILRWANETGGKVKTLFFSLFNKVIVFWLESANALCSLYAAEFLGFISAKPRERVNSQTDYSSQTILSHIRRRETERDGECGRVVWLRFHMTWRLLWHRFRATKQKSRTLFPLSWAAEIQIPKGTDRSTA